MVATPHCSSAERPSEAASSRFRWVNLACAPCAGDRAYAISAAGCKPSWLLDVGCSFPYADALVSVAVDSVGFPRQSASASGRMLCGWTTQGRNAPIVCGVAGSQHGQRPSKGRSAARPQDARRSQVMASESMCSLYRCKARYNVGLLFSYSDLRGAGVANTGCKGIAYRRCFVKGCMYPTRSPPESTRELCARYAASLDSVCAMTTSRGQPQKAVCVRIGMQATARGSTGRCAS